uniref:Interleukin 18 n=1 Tax=Leptobrachium leishanense TaxID=445787 RepID=A0A8C5Q4N6_9ANUR
MMSTQHHQPIRKESALQCDAWAQSNRTIKSIIVNYLQNTLEAHPEDFSEDAAVFKKAYDKARVIFDLKVYRDTMFKGFSVAFTIKIDDKPYYMYSNNSMELRFKEGVPPRNIPGSTSNVIFYQKQFSKGDSRYFVFESAVNSGYCLAYQDEGGKQKLILKHTLEDEVDETKCFQTQVIQN